MYLDELSPEQRRAFFVLAREVIAADRRLALAEVERLDRLYAEAHVPAETAAAPNAAADLNLLFGTPRARHVVLLELVLVAYADGELHAREAEAIAETADRLGLPAGAVERALDWAARYDALVAEGRAMGR